MWRQILMGTPPLTTKESAEGFMEFINNDDFITGKFIKKGGEHPW